jgi:hypothetical protein
MGTVQIVLDLHQAVEDYTEMLVTIEGARARALKAIAILEGDDPGDDVEEVAAAPVAATPAAPKPKPRSVRVAAPARESKYDYAKVAAVAVAAITAGEPSTAAVAAAFEVNAGMASFLVTKARELGHDIPKRSKGGRPAGGAPTPAPAPVPPNDVWTPDRARDVLDGAA